MKIKDKIKQVRLSRCLTQASMANILGCTPQSINNFERGRSIPGLKFLNKFSTEFEIPVAEVVASVEESK